VNAGLAEELAKRHDVTVLTSRAFDLPKDAVENGVRVFRVPVFFRRQKASANLPSMLAYLFTGAWGARILSKQGSFDIINTHFALPSGPLGRFLGRMWRIPNVLSVHGGDLYDPSKKSSPHRHAFLRSVVRNLALRADSVVAQSKDTLANLHRFFAPELPAELIPLGIPRQNTGNANRADYGFANTDVLLLTIGRLVGRKAVDQLIDAVAELGDEHVKLLVVGSGPLTDALEARARALGLADRVRFMGLVEERTKLDLLSIADLFVSTSQHEGFGLVFLEAMAAGLPIICYDKGGQVDFLKDEETGFVVPLNDRREFLHRLRGLTKDASARVSMGESNQQLVEEFYIENCAKQYEDLFSKVIGDRLTDQHDEQRLHDDRPERV